TPRSPTPPPDGQWRQCRRSPLVARDVRQDREETRTLDRRAHLPLVPRTHSADPTGKDLPTLGDEAGEAALVLVIDRTGARLTDRTGLSLARHALLLLVRVVVVLLLHRGDRGLQISLVHHDQITQEFLVELQQALELGQLVRRRREVRDHIVAILPVIDR